MLIKPTLSVLIFSGVARMEGCWPKVIAMAREKMGDKFVDKR